MQNGTFWLSDTPDSVSKGWDATLNRICTYALLHHRSFDRDIWVFNTHFDHVGKEAGFRSAGLISAVIDSLNNGKNFPVILTGELNAENLGDDAGLFLQAGLADTRILTRQSPWGPEGTYNGFEPFEGTMPRIDYIFVNEKLEVLKYGVLTDMPEGLPLSDHFPVLVYPKLHD